MPIQDLPSVNPIVSSQVINLNDVLFNRELINVPPQFMSQIDNLFNSAKHRRNEENFNIIKFWIFVRAIKINNQVTYRYLTDEAIIEARINFLQAIWDSDYFYPSLKPDQACQSLCNDPRFAYNKMIVRLSTSEPGVLSISFKVDDDCIFAGSHASGTILHRRVILFVGETASLYPVIAECCDDIDALYANLYSFAFKNPPTFGNLAEYIS